MKKVVLFRVRNQMNGVPIDRLNELPDSILIHILSFLTVMEAAATCVLSKRWQFLWSDVPSLRLWESENENEDPQKTHRFVALEKTRRFVACVNRLFSVRTTNSVEKFSLRMQYHDSFDFDIDEWICNALNTRVKTLILIIHSRDVLPNKYILPDEIYTSSSLEYLLIQGHIATVTSETISWRSLTELYLECVELYQEVVDDILSNCPVLRRVEFKWCFGFYYLDVKSSNIHTIVIQNDDEDEDDWLYISAPNLRFLDITFYPGKRVLKLGDNHSLYKARINFILDGDDEAIVSYTKELLEWIHHVQELQLNCKCFEVISTLAATGWQLPQSTRCRLEVSSSVAYKYNVSGIMALLESSPNLETLVLEGCNTNGNYAFPNPAAKDELGCNLLCLKNIYFRNYTDSNGEPMLTLVRILLKTAPFLENMEVVIDGVESSDDFTRIYQELLLFPRVNAISSESHQYQNKSRYKAAVIFR